MKRLFILILLLLLPFCVSAEVTENIMNEQIKTSGITELSQQLQQVDRGGLQFDVEDTAKSLAKGKWNWNAGDLLNKMIKFFLDEFIKSLGLLFQLLVLALLGALIENLQSSFGNEGIGNAAFYGCYLMIATVAVKAFIFAVGIANEVINDMVAFMNALIPVILSLVAMGGAPISSGIFHPVLMVSIQTVGLFIRSVIIPLIMLSTAVSCANHISEKHQLGKMASMLKTTAKWIMGLMLTVFVGIISFQSLVIPNVDGVSLKAAKFTVGSFVPVVGGILADSVDLVFSCGKLLKNAVGITGLIAICVICFAPSVKLLVNSAMLSLTGALIEPVSDKRIVGFISELGSSLALVFSMVLTVCIMFIINMAIIICCTNVVGMSGG